MKIHLVIFTDIWLVDYQPVDAFFDKEKAEQNAKERNNNQDSDEKWFYKVHSLPISDAEKPEKKNCDNHYWMPQTIGNGKPDFRVNPQMSKEPLVNATCKYCGVRSWFTESQWYDIPPIREEK